MDAFFISKTYYNQNANKPKFLEPSDTKTGEKMRRKATLITGAAGEVGQALVERIAEQNNTHIIKDTTKNTPTNVSRNAMFKSKAKSRKNSPNTSKKFYGGYFGDY